tara:strand:+ start:1175 stop:1711 length:537 start_codon:yes stop_codon:yes gene_type:complete
MDIDQNEIKKMAEKIAKEHVGKFVKGMNSSPDFSAVADVIAATPPTGGACNVPAPRRRASSNVPSKYTRQDIRDLVVKADTIACTECGHYTFENVFLIKRVSPLMSPSGEEMMLPVQVFQCTKCGGVNDVFLPEAAIADVKNAHVPETKKDRMENKKTQRRSKKEKEVKSELEVDKHL